MKKKILLGMSGGVDSSVAAILLQQQGYEVIGATMELWGNDEEQDGCGSYLSTIDAKKVCEKLGIEHYTFNFKNEFKNCVINDFINCYEQGKTPNPCIECNKHLKFNAFYKKALELGCDYIATGHYAKTEFSSKYNKYVLKKSDSIAKDQSYVLYNVPSSIVEKIIFPLSNFKNKDEIREIARNNGLSVAEKPDSQEICFIPDNDYGKFLKNNLKAQPKPGNIVTKAGEILGKHKGLIHYTIGQRKGLGISAETPLFVTKIDIEKNELVVGEEKEIFSTELFATDINYVLIEKLEEPIQIKAKIRYSAKEAEAVLTPVKHNLVKVEFKEPQRAITPGQSVVFYVDDIVLGGGKII